MRITKMKLFEFAIASIVDANTGHGLEGKNLSVDHSSAIHTAHEIRAKTILALFASIKHRIRQVISNYHVRANNRRAINEISKLSDRLLGDIGIERYELAQLRAGLITLEELDASRRPGQVDIVQALQSPVRIDKEVRKLGAVNQDSYVLARCA
jgi:uncharacterized protein YjiS (DUF1127 family)